MEKLRRHLGVLRGAGTRLLASANELLEDTEPTACDLQVAIDDLKEKDAVLSELDPEIAELLNGEEFEEKIAGALDYNETIGHAVSKVRFVLDDQRAPPTDVSNPGVSLQNDQSRGISAGAHAELSHEPVTHVNFCASTQRVTLPKRQIPVFSGAVNEWQGIWELFEACLSP